MPCNIDCNKIWFFLHNSQNQIIRTKLVQILMSSTAHIDYRHCEKSIVQFCNLHYFNDAEQKKKIITCLK